MDMTDKELIDRVRALDSAINQAECFGTGDIRELDACIAELERRGYTVDEVSGIRISKDETEEEVA